MININELSAGQRASFVHTSQVEFVQTREGLNAPQWLETAIVTRRAVFSGNVANEETYARFRQKQIDTENVERKAEGIKPLPKYKSSGKAWFRHHEEQAGIVLHNQSNKPYLAVLHPKLTKVAYTVNGMPVTPEQLADIQAWKEKSSKSKFFAVYDLNKVTCEGYIEDENLAEVED